MAANKVLCEACPVLCQITEGRTGACDRWGNVDGVLTRVDPIVLVQGRGDITCGRGEVRLCHRESARARPIQTISPRRSLSAAEPDGVDMVTVVTEGIFSYCSFKVKIDTDRFVGPEQGNVRHKGEIVGHVTTAEYGSQMLSIGGVHHSDGWQPQGRPRDL
jgi:hypothetical protein